MIAAQLLRMSYAQILSQCFLHLTRHHSLFEHKQKTALCVVLVFVVVCEVLRPFSTQPAAVAQSRFYNLEKGQAFRDQTRLLIYSVSSISGLW